METPHVCSAASKKGKYRTFVEVEPFSTRSVPYVIIPMKLSGQEYIYTIEVKAAALDFTDGVKKDLKVVVSRIGILFQFYLVLDEIWHSDRSFHFFSG